MSCVKLNAAHHGDIVGAISRLKREGRKTGLYEGFAACYTPPVFWPGFFDPVCCELAMNMMFRRGICCIQNAATLAFMVACALVFVGCGTTKWSDTSRTGTEQLLISNAIDSAVSRIDFTPIGDKRVFLDTEAIEGVTDHKYLAKSLRQHLAASGGILCDEKEDSDYIVEARAGAVGTDRDELLLIGIPAMSLPSLAGTEITGATIPEIPVVKQTKQRGVAKIAVFAYNRHTGRPVWASGNNQTESNANNLWIAGAGPLSLGTIYKAPTFAGHPVPRSVESSMVKNQRTFADRSAIFQEIPGEPPLKAQREAESMVVTADNAAPKMALTAVLPEMSAQPSAALPPTTPPQPVPPSSPGTVDPFLR